MFVYLLSHTHEVNPGEDDDKIIGIYSTWEEADTARQQASQWPGFVDVPDGFCIDKYRLNENHWTEGYVTLKPGEE